MLYLINMCTFYLRVYRKKEDIVFISEHVCIKYTHVYLYNISIVLYLLVLLLLLLLLLLSLLIVLLLLLLQFYIINILFLLIFFPITCNNCFYIIFYMCVGSKYIHVNGHIFNVIFNDLYFMVET